MVARRTRVVLLAIAVLLAWLAWLAPHLWHDRMRVVAFLGIVGLSAWGWGRPLRVGAAKADTVEAEPPAEAAPQALSVEAAAPDLAADLAPGPKLAE
jgi:hypothetical protein